MSALSGRGAAEVVGVFPAAGLGRRLGLANGSKELVAVPDIDAADGSSMPVGDYLLRRLRAAGARRVVLVRRAEKTDLAAHLRSFPGLRAHDLVVDPTPGTPHSLALGCRAVPDATVVSGFPDMIVGPASLGAGLVETLGTTGADLCLGLVPVASPGRWDRVTCAADGRVTDLVPLGSEVTSVASATLGWIMAAWRPAFTAFLTECTGASPVPDSEMRELSVGHVVRAAVRAELHVTSRAFPAGIAMDVGTPERLALARRSRGTGIDP